MKLSASIKILINLIYILTLFFIDSWIGYGIMFVILFVSCLFSKMSFREMFLFFIKLLPILLITAMMNMFYIEGKTIFKIFFIKVSDLGMIFALKMLIRIYLLLLSSKLLIHTTSPISLSKGIEKLIRPLKVFKINIHEFSMILGIALRFIPILKEELETIKEAQKARGIYVEKKWFKNIINTKMIIIPLIISIFRRSEQIALAMEARCYH